MSVEVNFENNYYLYSKGSPEKIMTICNKIPVDY